MSLGVNGPETAILEQLRLQEGRLFQGEKTLALYLDVKAVALDLVAQPTSPELEEDALESHVKTLKCLAPKGTQEYHEKALHDSVKTVAKLLWPTQMLLVARPKVATLLAGMYKRLKGAEPIKSGAFGSLDPFKQDFVIREAFRRTLVNDCLVVFDGDDAGSVAPGAAAAEDDWAERLDGGIGPDDSASQAPERPAERHPAERHTTAEGHTTAERHQRPPGARSALGPIGERDEAERSEPSEISASAEPEPERVTEASVVAHSTVEGPPIARAASVVAGSVAPRVITVTGSASVLGSTVSHATGLSGSSVLHKLNVRKVRITPDETA